MTVNPLFYNEDIKKIEKIEFTIYRNNDVKMYSAVFDDPFGIDLAESYENYEPKKGGLVDLRLGTCDPYLPCTTCGENSIDCPGHFGHTTLADKVFHFGFLNHLKNILQCICLKCSKILINDISSIDKKILSKKMETRFKEIKLLTKNATHCFNCGELVPKIKREVKDNGSIRIIIEKNITNVAEKDDTDLNVDQFQAKKIKEVKKPSDCWAILKNISDEECKLLGFDPKIQKPEDMIIKEFPIPPVTIRPTAKVDFLSAATMEDSLTLKISDIITSNKRLRQQMEKETLSNDISQYSPDMFTLLQYHIATYFDNESLSLPRTEFKTGGRPTKSMTNIIKGKTGRVRNNLMGKRVDFSARTVITSDPYIDIDQVGVPKRIAMELTVPEEVTPYNIKYLSGLVRNGKDTYPGANFVLRINYKDGKAEVQKIDLKYRKKVIKLNYGDIVERHSINDDYILFNRQPTLHKPSMMGHKMQVINSDILNTFRLNVSACKPYNADFDGDEMNMYLPQSIQTRNEIKRIANVQYQIVSAKDSSPIIGCQQDTLSGAYMLTEPDVKIIGWEAANILCNTTSETKMNIEMNKYYSGHEIFSHIIPEGINNTLKSNNNINFQILNGQLLVGHLDKSSLSFAKNSIIHFIWDKFGPNKTRKFIDDSQRLILNYLLLRGQTIGYKDTIIDKDILTKIKQIMHNEILKSKYNITQFENDVDQISNEIIETTLASDLGVVRTNVSQIISSHFNINNNFWVFAKSGAKGSIDNVTQICAFLGQKNLAGNRIKKNIESRSLIYFHKDDDTPEARGFIKNSYINGLSGYELFIDSSAGREGLIDTAIKTAQTGYIQRQLIKGLEDLSIKYDGTNRNAKNIIIQTIYGENGINQALQTELKLNILLMNNTEINDNLIFTKEHIKMLSNELKIDTKELTNFNKKYYDKLIVMRDNMRMNQSKALINYKILEEKYVVPVNLFRITQDYTSDNNSIDLNPYDIENAIEDFLSHHDYRLITVLNPQDKYMKNDDRKMKTLFELALYEYLAPVKCIFTYKLSKTNFNKMMDEIKLNFIKSIIEPGEMVGVIAAQSIGEPTSQLTLNTKHFAGTKSAATMGLNRILELLHYSKNIKIPEMTVYFKQPYAKDRSALNKVISYFKYLSIKDLINSAEIYYDLCGNDKLSKLIKDDNVSNPFFINNQKTDLSLLPFIFRFKMNIEKMIDKETTLLDIKTKFISQWYKNLTNIKNVRKKEIINNISRCAILSNNISDKEPYIHIRFSMTNFNYSMITDFLKIVLDDITLKGIENISNINVSHERVINYDKSSGDIIVDKEYVVYTSGINFEKMRLMTGIDFSRTRCNDIITTLRLYGIEATRQLLIYELSNTYKNSGSNINYNHLSLLVDQMCHTGEIISMDRHGLSKIDIDPIARASFEKTMEHFINAAIFNEKDNLKSVSSRIAVGRVINGGTGAFELLLDTKKLENSEYTKDETAGRITFPPLEEDPILTDMIKYSLTNTSFFIP